MVLSATDMDGDLLTYSATTLPIGASFDPATRIFHWTPGYEQSGTYQGVQFSVSDGILTDYENIILTVNNVNRPPAFTLTPSNGSTFNETDPIDINILANDPDNDPLTSLIEIDGVLVSTTSNYMWVTGYSSSGYHNIFISVSDGTVYVNSTNTIYINNVYPRYDLDENGIVDIADMVIIGQHFDEITVAPYPRYDVNMDGMVNILDVVIIAQHFGEDT